MKLIEPIPKTAEKASEQIRQLFQISKTSELADEAIVARFAKCLDNRYTMIRNFQPEGKGVIFPSVLIGPPGIFAINLSHAKGFFKVKEETWLELSKTNEQFEPARNNLIKESKDLALNLATILEAHSKSHPEIVPILLLADAGVHVETSNPAIRIILMDGVENWIDNLLNSREVLQPTEINYFSDALEIMANPDKAIPMGEGEDFFGKDLFIPEKKAPLTLPELPVPKDLSLPPVEEKLKFSRKQWIILALLLGLTIIILLVAILFALNII